MTASLVLTARASPSTAAARGCGVGAEPGQRGPLLGGRLGERVVRRRFGEPGPAGGVEAGPQLRGVLLRPSHLHHGDRRSEQLPLRRGGGRRQHREQVGDRVAVEVEDRLRRQGGGAGRGAGVPQLVEPARDGREPGPVRAGHAGQPRVGVVGLLLHTGDGLVELGVVDRAGQFARGAVAFVLQRRHHGGHRPGERGPVGERGQRRAVGGGRRDLQPGERGERRQRGSPPRRRACCGPATTPARAGDAGHLARCCRPIVAAPRDADNPVTSRARR